MRTPISNARTKTGRMFRCDRRQARAAQIMTVITATMMPSSASCAQLGGWGGVQQTTPCKNPNNMPTNAPEMRPKQRQSFGLLGASRGEQGDEADPAEIAAADGGGAVDRGADDCAR